MSQSNQISVKIAETDLAAIKDAINILKTKLMTYLSTLTPQERQELPKMGDKTVSFVQKAFEYTKQNPELVPSFLDLTELTTDIKAVQTLRELAQPLNPIVDALNDSLTLSGSEAYQGVLVFYNNVKSAARVKAPNAASIYDDLSGRFPGAVAAKKA